MPYGSKSSNKSLKTHIRWTGMNSKSNVTRAVKWMSCIPYKLPRFWIKQFSSLHESMATAYSQVLASPIQAADWLVEASTILLPKKVDTCIPKNYRPIAYFQTTFKILTSIITDTVQPP